MRPKPDYELSVIFDRMRPKKADLQPRDQLGLDLRIKGE
jgi:hypothetical protein